MAVGVDLGQTRKAEKAARVERVSNSFEGIARDGFDKHSLTWARPQIRSEYDSGCSTQSSIRMGGLSAVESDANTPPSGSRPATSHAAGISMAPRDGVFERVTPQ